MDGTLGCKELPACPGWGGGRGGRLTPDAWGLSLLVLQLEVLASLGPSLPVTGLPSSQIASLHGQ